MLLALQPTVGSMFLVLGAGIALVFGLVLWLIRRQHGVGPAPLPAEGEVLDFDEQFVGSDGGMVTRLQVRFRTHAGQTITGPTATGNSLARLLYRRGQRVQVRYDPANPQRFQVGSFDSANYAFIVVVFGLICLGLLVLGSFIYLLDARLPK